MTQPSSKGTDGSAASRGRFAAPVAGGAAWGIGSGVSGPGIKTGRPQGGAKNTGLGGLGTGTTGTTSGVFAGGASRGQCIRTVRSRSRALTGTPY